jgi:hypothetical protein
MSRWKAEASVAKKFMFTSLKVRTRGMKFCGPERGGGEGREGVREGVREEGMCTGWKGVV